eukprot:TRINITY_DN12602_c0_g1_i1.p1 TRINITY_DN12602_c0_g1~~TRINITY_DN12602_c0_g1_i1.p1  ORF type:complete len:622 (+),score=178.55 TRINITY_DN12602_c0_g1_i1:53-1867(+)
MLAELPNLPPLFASVSDTIKLHCGVGDDGASLLVSGVCNDEFYTISLKEKDAQKVKGSSEWKTFFSDVEKSFVGGTVTAQSGGGGLTVTCKGSAGDITFQLVKADGNGPLLMLAKLFSWYQLRNDKGMGEKLLEDLNKQDRDMRMKVQSLEQEKVQLQATATSSAAEEQSLMDEYTHLQAELSELTEAHKKACELAGKDPNEIDENELLDPEFSKPLGRLPMGNLLKRVFDNSLLKLIKSKFCPAADETDATRELDPEKDKWLSVIRPFTKPEFEAQMKSLDFGEKSMVMKVMEKVDKWDYDVWTIQDMTGKGSLFHTAYALFCRWDFFRKFNLNEEVCINFFSQIEAGYHPNPYHNSQHGADVLHIVHYICQSGGLRDVAKLTDEDVLAALIAGMIHDYDHPGLNNNFHVKVQSYLATLYNDRSILENHHCAEVFEMMRNPQFDILGSLTDAQRRDVRETIIEMVMSTDMGLHAKIFGTWKRRIGTDHDLHKRKDDQRLALSMSIKMADISNCGRPEHLYLKWGTKLAEEFFLQGDNERNRGDPVSPFMDRFAPSMAKSQIAFMNYIVIPMFESIAEYLPDMHFSVEHCENNKNYWASNDDSL